MGLSCLIAVGIGVEHGVGGWKVRLYVAGQVLQDSRRPYHILNVPLLLMGGGRR